MKIIMYDDNKLNLKGIYYPTNLYQFILKKSIKK